jgi:hypothetical protein
MRLTAAGQRDWVRHFLRARAMDPLYLFRFSRALHAGSERDPPDHVGCAVRVPRDPAAYRRRGAWRRDHGWPDRPRHRRGPAGQPVLGLFWRPRGGVDRLDGGAALARKAGGGRSGATTSPGASCAQCCSNGSTPRSGRSRWRRHRAMASACRHGRRRNASPSPFRGSTFSSACSGRSPGRSCPRF